MKWPQIVVMIEFLLWLVLELRHALSNDDSEPSHGVRVAATFIVICLIVANVFVLSAGGFW